MSAVATALDHDLALAASAAPPQHVVHALAGADPLRLDLPPAPGLQARPETLRAVAALYLGARLEDTGLMQVAEWLVQDRAGLRVPLATAQKLEDLARRWAHGQLPRDQRLRLYGQLFGVGAAAGTDPSGVGARFEPALAALCSALVAHAQGGADDRPGAVATAATDLAATASSSAGAGAVLAVPRLNDQLRGAIDLLSDPGVGTLVGGRGLWDVLRRFVEPNVPDVRRLLDCGRHGQRVLRWLADVLPALAAPAGAQAAVPPDVSASAYGWLSAHGLQPAPRGGLV